MTWKQLLIAAFLPIIPYTAWALESDRSAPIHIEADTATLNEADGTSNYAGNVQLRQGSLELRGDSMTIHLIENEVNRITLTGTPASLQQRRDIDSAEQHAQADNIEYSAKDERVILLGNARIWQNKNEEFKSERIVFNLKDNTVNAGGKDSEDRVHITLQPKSTPEETSQDNP